MKIDFKDDLKNDGAFQTAQISEVRMKEKSIFCSFNEEIEKVKSTVIDLINYVILNNDMIWQITICEQSRAKGRTNTKKAFKDLFMTEDLYATLTLSCSLVHR